MSLLFDQNLSRKLPRLLAVEYPRSEQVVGVGLIGADDLAVWAHAASRGLAVVSKDSDFSDLSRLLGPPPQVVWLRIGNASTAAIAALLRSRLADVTAFLADPSLGILELA